MTSLKNRLAEKVEIIESQPIENNKIMDSPQTNTRASENLILLRPQENNQNISLIPDFAVSINEAKSRIAMLQEFIKEMMVPGVDYGLIPNSQKPSLFKSGAEKLTDVFCLSKQFEVVNRIEDWEKVLFHYEIKATLINKRTGLIEAEGLGCCNNRERKYKSQDGFSIINTILKMAKKRALVDAVLSATRSSGIFTQDIEDSYASNNEQPISNVSKLSTSSSSINNINSNNKIIDKCNTSPITLISKSQQKELMSIINQKHFSIEDIRSVMNERYKITESKNLSSEQAEDFVTFLKSYNPI
jgi:hypothetical protein